MSKDMDNKTRENDLPPTKEEKIPPALPLSDREKIDWIRDGRLPLSRTESIPSRVLPWALSTQDIKYMYKVFMHPTIIFHLPQEQQEASGFISSKWEVKPNSIWYIQEEDLRKTFSEKKYKYLSLNEEKLKSVILNEVFISATIPDELSNQIPELKVLAGKKGKMIALGRDPLKPLTDYIKSIMSDNVLCFIQNNPAAINGSFETPLGVIMREGQEIHYDVTFVYRAENFTEFGKYCIETATIPEKTVSPISSPSPFENQEIAHCPSSIPVRTSTMALTRPDQWESDDKKLPHFVKKSPSGIIEHFIEAPEELEEEQKEQWLKENSWNIVKSLENEAYAIETAYVNLIYSAYAMNLQRPWDGEIKITGSEIIKYLGWDKKKKNTRKGDLLKEVYKIARNACRFGTGGYWHIGKNRFTIERGPHWVFMGEMWTGQLTFEGKPNDPTEIYLTIRPGLWTKYFINREGQQDGSALCQFSYIAKQTLQISVAREPMAAKLALYLTTMVKDREKDFKIETLLKAILTDSQFNEALNIKEKTHALKTQWDNALLRLKEIGWNIRFDPSYPDELFPPWTKDSEPPEKPRLPRNYIQKLLAAKVWFTAPAITRKLIQAPEPEKKKKYNATCLKGIDVKKAREAKKWSKKELGRRMGKSDTWVTYIENNNRPITKENEKKLREILQIPE